LTSSDGAGDACAESSGRFRLDGRVSIVTGASSGIGAHVAEVLRGAGATVIVAARRGGELERRFGGRAGFRVVPADVTRDADRQRVIGEAVSAGGLDVLVNNAGGDAAAGEPPVDRFRAALELNLVSAYALSLLAVEAMPAGGSIVNIASIFGLVAPGSASEDGYSAAKAGLVHLTRQMASTGAARQVRVNAVAPGFFPTAQTADVLASESTANLLRRRCPMRRVGRLEELDGVVLLLASDASSYITGQTIAVDGGWTTR